MIDDTISLADIFDIVKRNIVLLSVCFVASVVVALGIAFMLPEQFKASSTLSIPSSYFRNPLVSDLLPEEHDQSELRAQRESLLRQALDDTFLNTLGKEFGIFTLSDSEVANALERKLLLENIEYYSLNPNTYQLSIVSRDRTQAFEMNKVVLAQMTQTLADSRMETLLTTQKAIDKHVSELGVSLKTLSQRSSVKDAEQLRVELSKVNADLDALLMHYTDKHPEVFKLRRKARSLQSLLTAVEQQESKVSGNKGPLLSAAAKEPIQAVYNDLLKKLNYLNIIVDMERESGVDAHISIVESPSLPTSPFFPNKKLFLVFGVFVGLALGLALMIWRELSRKTFLAPEQLSESLGLPYLGELPALDDTPELPLLLSSDRATGVHRELPWQSLGSHS